ncbi:MAG: hypothetical protein FJ150_06225 [Euryarchaeota archaeon]|nr:hypothetical protein [Euryarchaeota archaeon]
MGQIREVNPKGGIIIVLDNFSLITLKKTKKTAKKLSINLTFPPPYSPDLNPVGFIWKSIKRGISPLLIKSKEHIGK